MSKKGEEIFWLGIVCGAVGGAMSFGIIPDFTIKLFTKISFLTESLMRNLLFAGWGLFIVYVFMKVSKK